MALIFIGLLLKGAEHSQVWFISVSVSTDDTQNSEGDSMPFQDFVKLTFFKRTQLARPGRQSSMWN